MIFHWLIALLSAPLIPNFPTFTLHLIHPDSHIQNAFYVAFLQSSPYLMWHTYREGVNITPFHLLGQVLVIKTWQEGTVYLQQLFPPLRGLQTIFLNS